MTRLKIHLSRDHGMFERKKYTCPHPNCGKIFTEKCNLNVHTRTHQGLKPYNCEHCGKEFTSIGNLKDHVRRHLQDK